MILGVHWLRQQPMHVCKRLQGAKTWVIFYWHGLPRRKAKHWNR